MEPAEDYLRLTLNSLHLLEKDKRPPALLKAIFELRLTAIAGFAPDLSACSECGAECGSGLFSPAEGTLICGECGMNARRPDDIPVGPAVLSAMRHVIYSPAETVFNFSLSGESLEQFCGICEKDLLYYAEKPPVSLTFLKTML